MTRSVIRGDDHARFWSKVDKTETCWLWTDPLSHNGYGRFSVSRGDGSRKTRMAHLVAYSEIVGDVPEGLELDHLCRVRHCVRPDHLEPVTHGENVRRSRAARPLQTHCKRGHLMAEARIDKYGVRHCPKCDRVRRLKYVARKAAGLVNGAAS